MLVITRRETLLHKNVTTTKLTGFFFVIYKIKEIIFNKTYFLTLVMQ